jgi:hypothetical protein
VYSRRIDHRRADLARFWSNLMTLSRSVPRSISRSGVLAVAVAMAGIASLPAAAAQPEQAQRWIRVADDNANNKVSLQVAARSFKRKSDERVIWLASAVHVGDRSYYRALQESLDTKDVVLYEGVKPPGAGRHDHDLGATDEDKVDATKKRLRFLGVAVKMHESARGQLPAALTDLTTPSAKGETLDERIAPLVAASMTDAWGNAIAYTLLSGEVGAGGFELFSLGADGKTGGEGIAADIRLSDQKPISDSEIPDQSEGGIQQQLAGALGLVFQLDAMDHSGANWRNSDLSVDQVTERITGSGGDADELFQTLGGQSFGAKVAGTLLRFIGSNQMFSTLAKAMMVEVLGQADELMDVMPGEMGRIMDVIVKDRNQVVLDDLVGVLEHEPDKKNIAVIYGAGHMPDLEARLAELGFAEDKAVWFNAITVDLDKTGMSRQQTDSLRSMLRDSIKDQAKILKRAKPTHPR